jgi:hypothetical protein
LIETLLATNAANQSGEETEMQTYVFVARSFGDLATENIFRYIFKRFKQSDIVPQLEWVLSRVSFLYFQLPKITGFNRVTCKK